MQKSCESIFIMKKWWPNTTRYIKGIVHSTLLGIPVQSNAIQCKCSAIKSPFMMTIMFRFVDTVIEVFIQLYVLVLRSQLIVVVLYWAALYWEVLLIFCSPHVLYVNGKDKKLGTLLNIMYGNTTFNYDLSDEHNWIRQSQHKLNIMCFIKICYESWIALDCTCVANKVAAKCIRHIAQ